MTSRAPNDVLAGARRMRAQSLWRPTVGPFFSAYAEQIRLGLARTTESVRDAEFEFGKWRADVERACSRTGNPAQECGKNAQLVVGRIQSGKTRHFLGCVALLADNGYDMVVVLSGTKLTLFDQTTSRIVRDLRSLDTPASAGRFQEIRSDPKMHVAPTSLELTSQLGSDDAQIPHGLAPGVRVIPVLTVLKDKSHLAWTNSVMKNVHISAGAKSGNDYWQKRRILIIDDEADQASPDVRAPTSPTASAIHDQIRELRNHFPHHSFLAYTATPQANVLMDAYGALAPESVTVISPGTGYIGTEDLFSKSAKFAGKITDWPSTTPGQSNPSRIAAVPSLQLGLRQHLVATALLMTTEIAPQLVDSEWLKRSSEMNSGQRPPTTMLVHPDWTQRPINATALAVRQMLKAIVVTASGYSSGDVEALKLARELSAIAQEVTRGSQCPDIDSGDLCKWVGFVAHRTRVLAIHSGSGGDPLPSVDEGDPAWSANVSWILVGGEILGRGLTLPNLLTTYMPRKRPAPGQTRTMDTLQQRGRFFGYRSEYRKLLSGQFGTDTLADFRELAEVEPEMLAVLRTVDRQGGDFRTVPHFIPQGFGGQHATRRQALASSAQVLNLGKKRGNAWPILQRYGSAALAQKSLAFLERHDCAAVVDKPTIVAPFPSSVELLDFFAAPTDGWGWAREDSHAQLVDILHFLLKSLPGDRVPSAELIVQWARSDGNPLRRGVAQSNLQGILQVPTILSDSQRRSPPGSADLRIFVQVFDLIEGVDSRVSDPSGGTIVAAGVPFAGVWLAPKFRSRVTALVKT